MIKLEEIRDRMLGDVSRADLNIWIMDEITGLSNDMGQRIDDEMLKHTAERLKGILLGKYRSWAVGEIHAAFQQGMSNSTARKVTVQALMAWIRAAEKVRVTNTVYISENEPRTSGELLRVDEYDFGSFTLWCIKNEIWFSKLFPMCDINSKEISNELRELYFEWKEAKQMDMLDALRRRLKTEVYADTE